MIDPTPKDLGRKVRYRDYSPQHPDGRWIEGALDGFGRMYVTVELANGCRDLNRVDVEFVGP